MGLFVTACSFFDCARLPASACGCPRLTSPVGGCLRLSAAIGCWRPWCGLQALLSAACRCPRLCTAVCSCFRLCSAIYRCVRLCWLSMWLTAPDYTRMRLCVAECGCLHLFSTVFGRLRLGVAVFCGCPLSAAVAGSLWPAVAVLPWLGLTVRGCQGLSAVCFVLLRLLFAAHDSLQPNAAAFYVCFRQSAARCGWSQLRLSALGSLRLNTAIRDHQRLT